MTTTTMPNPEKLLNAEGLDDMEWQDSFSARNGFDQQPIPILTMGDAVDAMRRIRTHSGRLKEIGDQAKDLIAPLMAEIDKIKEWEAAAKAEPEFRINLHTGRLRAYYEMHPPLKGKTLKLPGGKISYHARQPEWKWQDEKAATDSLPLDHPALQLKTVIDKAALKKCVEVRADGSVVDAETGVLIPGVVVIERDDKFSVEID